MKLGCPENMKQTGMNCTVPVSTHEHYLLNQFNKFKLDQAYLRKEKVILYLYSCKMMISIHLKTPNKKLKASIVHDV